MDGLIVNRKQILVLKYTDAICTSEIQESSMRADIMKQMETGIVFIPPGLDVAAVIDADEAKFVVNGEQK